jgi:hypothetical protein
VSLFPNISLPDGKILKLCLPSIVPNYFITLKELGLAMVNSVLFGNERKVLEAKDIVGLAKKQSA